MPRLPIDYSRTVMYKLCCLDQSINDIYIGHTTDFIKRKYSHKNCCCNESNKEYNYKVYQFIRANGGWNSWRMIQIEEYPCNNVREAEARETDLMKELNSTLNNKKSFITEEEKREYYKKDKYKEYEKTRNRTDKRKEYMKEYHKEYIKTKQYKEHINKRNREKALYLNELKCYNI